MGKIYHIVEKIADIAKILDVIVTNITAEELGERAVNSEKKRDDFDSNIDIAGHNI
jgi:hypothetical protein